MNLNTLDSTLESDSLTFLDTLRIREEATYVLTEDTQGEDVAGYAKGASVISARSLLEHYVSKRYAVGGPQHRAVMLNDPTELQL